jgi:hypothetical protein
MSTDPHPDPSRRFTIAGAVVVAVLLASELATHLVDYGVYDLRVRAMDANLGSSPVAWASPTAIAIALVSAWVLARRGRVSWGLVAALAVVLPLGTRHLGESLPHWQFILLPPLGLTLFLLWREAQRLDPLASGSCRAGCVLLVLAFVLHVFGGAALRGLGVAVLSWPYQVKVSLKEGIEISGWLLVANGLAATAIASRRPRVATRLGLSRPTP